MKELDFSNQKKILAALSGKIDDYYLGGGTALSMVYFHHRESYDLDFFTKEFSKGRVVQIIDELKKVLNIEVELIAEQTRAGMARMAVYLAHFDRDTVCKIDFVEDVFDLTGDLSRIDGINMLSLKDIYLRKVFTVAGHIKSQDMTGREVIIGGRQEARDFFDLYYLSTTSVPLAAFAAQHKDPNLNEGLIRWYRTYDRMAVKTGLLDVATNRKADFKLMEGHFKNEIDRLLAQGIEGD